MSIICALDTHSIDEVYRLLNSIKTEVSMFKVGLELYSWFGYPILQILESKNIPIFLDLKFHDIPHTVYHAINRFNDLSNIIMLTVHAAGGEEMINMAVDATDKDIIAVTLLTSIIDKYSDRLVNTRTERALNAGAAGVVCSPREVKMLRKNFGNNFKIVVPGIRPHMFPQGREHKRVGTPRQAMKDGASYLVIGRPITIPRSALEAVQKIKEEISG